MMESFRDLYGLSQEYTGYDLYADVIKPNLDAACELMEPLQRFRRLRDAPPITLKECANSGLYDLFALQVLNDYLLLPLTVSQQEYQQFFTALGFEVFTPDRMFNPLYCEIVEASNWGQPEEGILADGCYWPGLRFGEMIFSRCGVHVRCHPSHQILAGVANQSKLYFTNRRLNRECEDASHGWGSNSRWATAFHRYYETDGFVFLNVDGGGDLSASRTPGHGGTMFDDLPVEAARELLLHRCFVQYNEPHEDPFPYHWCLALRNDVPLWPLPEANIVSFKDALDTVIERPPSAWQRFKQRLQG